jgi:hypothetical protein
MSFILALILIVIAHPDRASMRLQSGCKYPSICNAQTGLSSANASIFEEKNGVLAVEAEHFSEQTDTEVRKWYVTTPTQSSEISPDPDPNHAASASGKAYLEILPDTRTTHDDKLIQEENFTNQPGKMAVLSYTVYFNTPGKYFVWVRAYSTGSEDNGLHVGLDGNWPASGQRMQWCEGKNAWTWESKQRTEAEHCGEPEKIFLEVTTPGEHTIHFSMREDGLEFDKWMMTLAYEKPEGAGIDELQKQ